MVRSVAAGVAALDWKRRLAISALVMMGMMTMTIVTDYLDDEYDV